MTKNSTSFKPGNKASQIYTFEEAEKIFEEILEASKVDPDILCFQDAIFSKFNSTSSYHHLDSKYPELNHFKRDIQDAIITRINRGGLQNKLNPTMCIWRMKQLGESETQHVQSNTSITWNEVKTYEAQ